MVLVDLNDPRCACGYFLSDHPLGRCPLCRAGKCDATAAEHLPVMTPPSPAVAVAYRQNMVCPVMRRNAAGEPQTIRGGAFRLPDADPPRRLWHGMLVPDEVLTEEMVPETRLVPLVTMRPPAGPEEIPTNAIRMGTKARREGWAVLALYSMGADETEALSIRMARGEYRAVALWFRPAGNRGQLKGWRADSAYGWRVGHQIYIMGHTELGRGIQWNP